MTKTNTVLATIVKEKARVENSIEREGAIKKNVENTEAELIIIFLFWHMLWFFGRSAWGYTQYYTDW